MNDRASSTKHSNRAVIRQSGLTGLAAGLSVIFGLLLDITVAARFGAGKATDSFFVAARIPLGLVAVVMVVANQALVPAFSTSLAKRGPKATNRLVSMIICAVLLGGGLLWLLVSLLAGPLVRLTAPGLAADQVTSAAAMVPIVFAIVPLVAVSEVMRAFLNARYAFVAPALMNVVLSGLAAAVILVSPHHIQVVAWGYLAGATAQVTFMAAMAVRRGLRFRPGLDFGDRELRGVGALSMRPTIAAGLNPVARIGEQLIVSFLPPGSITILNYAYRLISAIGGTVFFRSVIVAVIPRMTEAHARDDNAEVLRLTQLGLRIMLAISVPLTAFMAVLAKPAALVVFQRGNFTHSSASLLGIVLAVYSISLVGSALQRVLLAPFFARLDTRTPLLNQVYFVAANLVLLPVLTLPFGRNNENAIIGIALAFSLAQLINVGHAWHRLRHDVGPPARGLGWFAPKLIASSGLSAATMLGLSALLHLADPLGRGELLLRTLLTGAAGAAVLAVTTLLLAGGDLSSTWRSLRRRRGSPPVAATSTPAPAPVAADVSPGPGSAGLAAPVRTFGRVPTEVVDVGDG